MTNIFSDEKIRFITLSNDGYYDLTSNCIKSMIKCELDFEQLEGGKFFVYSIGDKCKNLELEYPNIVEVINLKDILDDIIEDELNIQTYETTKSFSTVVQRKFFSIVHSLERSKYTLFTDGDIVFLDNSFIQFSLNLMRHNDSDFVCQTEKIVKNQEKYDFCSGFMLIKNTKNNLKIFDSTNTEQFRGKTDWTDQTYVNECIKSKKINNVVDLPIELFPNGKYFQDHFPGINPLMIHFNWLYSNDKIPTIKKYNFWYLLD